MPALNQAQIRQRAVRIVRQNPQGIRFSHLLDQISQSSPQTPRNTISSSIYNLSSLYPNDVARPSRGVLVPVSQGGAEVSLLPASSLALVASVVFEEEPMTITINAPDDLCEWLASQAEQQDMTPEEYVLRALQQLQQDHSDELEERSADHEESTQDTPAPLLGGADANLAPLSDELVAQKAQEKDREARYLRKIAAMAKTQKRFFGRDPT